MSSKERSWKPFVQDMLHAIKPIQRRTAGRSFEEFAADEDALEIVAWNFTVLGEASTHVPAIVIDTHPELPWADMRAMRNQVIHGYFRLNPKILWDTATAEIPTLLGPLHELAAEEPNDTDEGSGADSGRAV